MADLNLYVTRDSVCAGDDADAPHRRTFVVPGEAPLHACLAVVISSGYLPSIAGGKATWSVTSAIPLAVYAQQWAAPRMLFLTRQDLDGLDRAQDLLRLHFSYHVQRDPEVVHEVLSRLRLRATP